MGCVSSEPESSSRRCVLFPMTGWAQHVGAGQRMASQPRGRQRGAGTWPIRPCSSSSWRRACPVLCPRVPPTRPQPPPARGFTSCPLTALRPFSLVPAPLGLACPLQKLQPPPSSHCSRISSHRPSAPNPPMSTRCPGVKPSSPLGLPDPNSYDSASYPSAHSPGLQPRETPVLPPGCFACCFLWTLRLWFPFA